MIDIGKLQTHVGWLAKGLIGLATVSAVVLGWLIINLYGPMHDLATNVAVQSAAISDMREGLGEIRDKMDTANDEDRKKSSRKSN